MAIGRTGAIGISIGAVVGIALSTVAPAVVSADTWQGRLERGGQLWIDPDTRRAFRSDGNEARPMWDGVHRLDDGSTVIIRDGIAVPTDEMLDAWQEPPRPVSESTSGPCAELVSRVCGRRDACTRTAACFHAHQLLSTERAEQRLAPLSSGSRPETTTSAACRAALADADRFPACARGGAAVGRVACQALVKRVCGDAGQCADSPACGPARQLLKMQDEAAEAGEDPRALVEIERQCTEALTNDFFEPCQ